MIEGAIFAAFMVAFAWLWHVTFNEVAAEPMDQGSGISDGFSAE